MLPDPVASHFVRLLAIGRDRAKFLHNFCTNNIKELAPGSACEAFFTDVKAKVLAHGYVLAFDASHEIWIRPGDPDSLLKHLNRYIITEDVTITGMDASPSICYPASDSVCSVLRTFLPVPENLFAGVNIQQLRKQAICFTNADLSAANESLGIINQKQENSSNLDLRALLFVWAEQPLVVISGTASSLKSLTVSMDEAGLCPLSENELERLRILDRFPIIGRDMTSDNLAPEAERNAIAISYTKGCYLGQEPIARLDAMGHVNRALRTLELRGSFSAPEVSGGVIKTADGASPGIVTSAVSDGADRVCGLSMIRLNTGSAELTVELSSGETVTATLLPPQI